MASDWQVGDLAVCVDASPRPDGIAVDLVEGRTYHVTAVCPPGRSKFGFHTGLQLRGATPVGRAFAECRFRKVRPDEHKACEEEFQTLLRRSRNLVSA